MNVDPGFWHTYIDFSTTTSDQSQVGSNWLLLANRQYLPTHGDQAFHTAPAEIPELSRFLLVVPPNPTGGCLMATLCPVHRSQGTGHMSPGCWCYLVENSNILIIDYNVEDRDYYTVYTILFRLLRSLIGVPIFIY